MSEKQQDPAEMQRAILNGIRELRVVARQQVIALNDERNRFAALEREHSRTRAIVEQLLDELLVHRQDLEKRNVELKRENTAILRHLQDLETHLQDLETRSVELKRENAAMLLALESLNRSRWLRLGRSLRIAKWSGSW